jgi:hypothetical protein
MAVSSILAIFALAVASIVAVFTLLTEKPEIELVPGPLRRLRKPGLYILTFLTMALGSWQIRKADGENHEAEQTRTKQHAGDQKQIIQLQQSVTNFSVANDQQYKRYLEQIAKLQSEVSDLKLAKLSEADRQKISALEEELVKARQPKPKAVLKFGFFYPNMKTDEVRTDKFVTSNGEPIKISFNASNISDVDAANVLIWIRICLACKYHSEPKNGIKVDNAAEFDREFVVRDIPPHVGIPDITAEIEVPRDSTKAAVSFFYRCADCVIENEFQTLWVDVGQIPQPHFAPPSPTSKQPIKPQSPTHF